MKKYLTLLIFALTPFVFFPYCSNQSTSKTTYEWNITITNGELNQPVSEIKLLVNGEEYNVMEQIDAPMEHVKSEKFKEKGIPDSAVLACSGFWAGYEQVLYLSETKNGLDATLLTFEEGFEKPQVAKIGTIETRGR